MDLSELESARTARQQVLIGQDAQVALNRAHVLIVGAGGLGCPVLQQLAAAGIGHITLIDDDEVALSNIHRQVLFGVDDVGQPKAAVAARRAGEGFDFVVPNSEVNLLKAALSAELRASREHSRA